MYSHSSKTVRVSGIRGDTPKARLESYAESLCTSYAKGRLLGLLQRIPLTGAGHPAVSLASQSGAQTGTITFPFESIKKIVPKTYGDWSFDDEFMGLTVLQSDPEPELDIVAVHGFNGNAFDTFAWDGEKMWLRDFLPLHPQLAKTRIMTFGYSSHIRDRSNTAGVPEWASSLLGEVASVRVSPAEKSRPLIFVCHSLGGLVAREAMIELNREPLLYDGLSLKHCGLLFLATPHSGSDLAAWNSYFVQLVKLAGIRSRDFSDTLKSFAKTSMLSKGEFGRLEPIPPYECLYETRETRVGYRKKMIVEADSAGLLAVKAQPMANVDHRQICRFPRSTDPGYRQVVACLQRIWDTIVTANAPRDSGIAQLDPQQPIQQQQPVLRHRRNTEEEARVAHGTENPPAPEGIEGGRGTGGAIRKTNDGVVIGGGHATGAKMSLRDLKDFTGTVEGGTGLGAYVST